MGVYRLVFETMVSTVLSAPTVKTAGRLAAGVKLPIDFVTGKPTSELNVCLTFAGLSPAWLCSVGQTATGAPPVRAIKTTTYVGNSGYEPEGREFESLRARQSN
jgi:hypothetical protein